MIRNFWFSYFIKGSSIRVDMEKETVIFLLQKHIAGTLTEADKIELTTFIDKKQHKEVITAALEELLSRNNQITEFDEKRFMPLVAGVFKADVITDEDAIADSTTNKRKGVFGKKAWLALMALVFVGALSVYFYYFKPFPFKPFAGNNNSVSDEVAPGGYKALLTLFDGSTIVLDSVADGLLTQQGNAKVTKVANGELSYSAAGETNSNNLFNTVTTPRGGQYQVVLSDGSRIKLNAFSSVTYPTTFGGKDRSVTITGEAYFEIAKNAKKPFKIRVYDMEVEVSGTEFNINAYTDEPAIKTTLIKGNIKLTNNEMLLMLHASQQGQFDKQGNFSLEKNIDTNEVIAWKNGLFQFNNADAKTAIRQIGRWYNVDVVYEKGALKNQEVFGEIRRNVNLSEVVKLLKKSDINCSVEGRTLFVRP